jgi:hypothetical protein
MRIRSLIYGLAVLFLLGSGAEIQAQDCYVPHRRTTSLIDLFQQRLCGVLCNCTSQSPFDANIQKAVAQKAVPVQKPSMVQKPVAVQKSGCRREVGDMVVECRPCGSRHPYPVSNLLARRQGTRPPLVSGTPCKGGKGEDKAKHVVKRGCGCEPDVSADFTSPIPMMIEKPQMLENPFQDDVLQPAPLPSAPLNEVRVLPRSIPRDASAESGQPSLVRFAAYYDLPVQID